VSLNHPRRTTLNRMWRTRMWREADKRSTQPRVALLALAGDVEADEDKG